MVGPGARGELARRQRNAILISRKVCSRRAHSPRVFVITAHAPRPASARPQLPASMSPARPPVWSIALNLIALVGGIVLTGLGRPEGYALIIFWFGRQSAQPDAAR